MPFGARRRPEWLAAGVPHVGAAREGPDFIENAITSAVHRVGTAA
jgi:hypothetical protein